MDASVQLSTPPDPSRYKFDNFIADICEQITNEDLNELKHRFKNIIDAEVQTPWDMFDALEKGGYIDCYNILYIQQVIRVLKKEALLEIAAKYANLFEEDKVLHVIKKSTKTAAGFDIVEFHVKGRLPLNEDLEHFRWKISTILLVPFHEVIFKGVQETRSFLITVSLPKLYVDFLINQLRKNKQHIIASFLQLQVDQIILSVDTFELQQDGTFFVAKTISAQKVHSSKGKRKVTQGEQKQKSPDLQTDVDNAHGQTLKKRKRIEEEPLTSILPRSHVLRTSSSMTEIKKLEVVNYAS